MTEIYLLAITLLLALIAFMQVDQRNLLRSIDSHLSNFHFKTDIFMATIQELSTALEDLFTLGSDYKATIEGVIEEQKATISDLENKIAELEARPGGVPQELIDKMYATVDEMKTLFSTEPPPVDIEPEPPTTPTLIKKR